MSRIKIENFGPIVKGCLENNGWIDIKKVTTFIGNQGSGKSTVAKLISTFTWIEKALVRGDYEKEWFETDSKLKTHYFTYHRLENYFKSNEKNNTCIEYQGDAYYIKYEKEALVITENADNLSYQLPQIMYVPAERNFISYVKSPKELKLSSDSLKEFLTEFDNAKHNLEGLTRLPINETDVEYDTFSDTLSLKGNNYRLKLTESSSGFQSLVPLYLVSDYLANSVKKQSSENKEQMSSEERNRFKKGVEEIWSNKSLTDEQKRVALSVLSSKFNKSAFINIVEEPEQNLFPASQWHLLQSLLELNNLNEGNKLIMTAHSPYIVNYLSISILGHSLMKKINESGKADSLISKLNKVVSVNSLISPDDVVTYQLNEISGSISKLDTYEGIPSDSNYLNNLIKEGNRMFDSLLEIEEELH